MRTGPALRRLGLDSRWVFVSLGALVYWAGPQSVRLYYPLELEDRGAGDLLIGLAVAGASVAALVLAIPSGYLLDRLNSHLALVASLVALAVTTASFALPMPLWAMIGLMLVQGVFGTWVWLVLQEMITRVGRGPGPERQLSLFSLAWGVGLAVGPALWAAWYAGFGFETVAITCGAVTVAGAAIAWFVPRELRLVDRPVGADLDESAVPGAPGTGRGSGMRAALSRSIRHEAVVAAMVASFVNVFVLSLRFSFYPLYLERHGVSLAVIGVLLSVIGGCSLAVRVVLPPAVRRIGNLRLLLLTTWVTILGAALTPVSTHVAVLLLGALMMGAGLGANPPITVALLAGRDAADRGLAVGLRMVANRSAQVAQPLLFGSMAGAIGLGAAFPVAGVLLAGLTLWLHRRLRRAV